MQIKVNDKHYEKNGEKYDRVTSIIKYLHGNDLSNIPQNILDNAKDRGNSYHFYLQQIAEKKINNVMLEGIKSKNSEMYDNVIQLQNWFKENVKKIILCEKPLVSEKLKIGGTPDILVTLNDKSICLIDLKCTYAVSPVHIIQLSGYTIILEENKYKPNKNIILHLNKNKIDPIEISKDYIIRGKTIFLQALALKRHLNLFKPV